MLFRLFRQKSAEAISVSLFVLGGCSGTDVGYPRVSDTVASCPDVGMPAAGTSTASESGGAPSGGTPSGGASNHAGTGATAMAGANSVAGGANLSGAPSTTPFVWPGSYDAATLPMPSDGHHNPGAGCMSSPCHGSKVPFAFGGTVYKADGVTGAPNVEVGITDGVLTVTAYSASNGNIWLPSSVGAIDFGSAQIVIRSANGERIKAATAPRGSACNGGGCHGTSMRLLEP